MKAKAHTRTSEPMSTLIVVGTFQHAACLVKEVDEHMIMSGPRTAGKQRRRAAPTENSEESY